MKRFLLKPEELILSLKIGRTVYVKDTVVSYKMVDGLVCEYIKDKCDFVNVSIPWKENCFYVEERLSLKGLRF